MVKVPYSLLADASFDIPSMLGEMLGERIGRFLNGWFTVDGTGASQANALLNSTSTGKTSAGATAITFAELLGLIHSVDIAYRSGAKFMFHDSILEYLRKQVDGSGNLIWQQSYRENEPDRIHGYGYVINNDMTGTTNALPVTATKHVVFGQLNKYKVRRVAEVRFYRLQELYRGNDQDGFVTLVRYDGNLLDTGTDPVKHLLQA
jgi:HK97 family phage major capsid protein